MAGGLETDRALDRTRAAAWPVHDISAGASPPEDGIAVCLSGGGYRAMLFHVGALWRINEAGLLGKVARFSSVSGGSMTAGILGYRWHALTFADGIATNLESEFVSAVRELADSTLDLPAIAGGVLLPGDVASRIVDDLDRKAFHGATLQDLPADPPRFVINATNLESGVLFRFSRPYMRDYRVGEIRNPQLRLAEAVAASAAFPPFLSPLELDMRGQTFSPVGDEDLHSLPYTDRAELADGGVYDNLGLETAFKRYRTLLVSDGGGQFTPDADPPNDWVRHLLRVLQVIDHQVRSLRARQLIAAYQAQIRVGAYWGIATPSSAYSPAGGGLLAAPATVTAALASVPTRLASVPPETQEQLINWGYASCDASMRTHFDPTIDKPAGFPYPATGLRAARAT